MGFEPTETRRPQRLSRPSHSSALASFRLGRIAVALGATRPAVCARRRREALVTMSATASNVHAEANRAARSKPMEVLARLGLATRGVLYLLMASIVVELVRTRGTEDDQASNTRRPARRSSSSPSAASCSPSWRSGSPATRSGASPRRGSTTTTRPIERLANVGSWPRLRRSVRHVHPAPHRTARSSSQDGSGRPAGGHDVRLACRAVDRRRHRARACSASPSTTSCAPSRASGASTSTSAGLSAGARRAVEIIAWVGLIGRTIAFGLVGWFLLRAAVQFDKTEPVGLDQSLRNVADRVVGPVAARGDGDRARRLRPVQLRRGPLAPRVRLARPASRRRRRPDLRRGARRRRRLSIAAARLGEHAVGHRRVVVEAGIGAHVVERRRRTRLQIGGAVDEAADAGVEQAHRRTSRRARA